jgi:hypothetical protein
LESVGFLSCGGTVINTEDISHCFILAHAHTLYNSPCLKLQINQYNGEQPILEYIISELASLSGIVLFTIANIAQQSSATLSGSAC